ncbi:MAG TPA: polyphosphate kinase 2 family protein [Ignavibacteria bacterium]|nr:polyphosphate kinase 2 family protein [Ignavibacteria bacterium]
MEDNLINTENYIVREGTKVSLKNYPTEYSEKKLDKSEGEKLLESGKEKLSELQDKLYAHNQYSVLIIFQAMDTAGKDGAIKHIMSGLNPTGVKVNSFKTPSSTELEHDYLWRHYIALPARGEIGIFNRSHYENVLVTRVHPEYILNENLPEINTIDDIKDDFWKERFKQINRFEKNIYQNGTVILKFFLHLSEKEQKKRFIDRIDDPKKNWKFSPGDAKERKYWNDYQKAYEDALSNTSTDHAPWYVIPADNKWFTRLAITYIIYRQFESLRLEYPIVNEEKKSELLKVREELENENKN